MRSHNVLGNEKNLLLLVARGDEISFTRLFNHYRSNLYTTALRMTGDEGVAEEILQDAFLKVWLKRETLPAIENFGGWLYTIAENLTYNAIKRLQREKKQSKELNEYLLPDVPGIINDDLQDKEYEAVLNTAVQRLPEKQQQTYKLIKQ